MSDETEESTGKVSSGHNPNSRAALEAHRGATQYGQHDAPPRNNDPGGANTKAWSVRHSIRHIAGQQIDSEDPKAMSKLLPKKPTVSQMIAAKVLIKATNGDMRAIDSVIEQIDGKVAQANINADLAALETMTDEQLYEIIDRFNAQRYSSDAGNGGDGSPAAPDGSETPA